MALISENMEILRDEYGFDSIAAREECLRLAGPFSRRRVLDVGTGSGWMAILLARNGCHVISVDVDRGAIQRASERAEAEGGEIAGRISFVQADALRLPFAAGSFDSIFSFDTMHHMPECHAAITEAGRVGKTNGTMVVADLNAKGLAAVREVVQQHGEVHYENECRTERIAEFLRLLSNVVRRYDLEFVTVFVFSFVQDSK